jgi:hypothetical protein
MANLAPSGNLDFFGRLVGRFFFAIDCDANRAERR